MPAVVAAGTRVGPYEVIETAYEGAFSVVYRCREDSLPRELAVKAVRRDGAHADLARRYALREARLRALVAHPHVLPLYRLVERGSDTLLVAPWLSGGSLRDVPPRAFSLAELGALATGLGRALDALHSVGWWHGDVSPGNVLFPTRPDGAAHAVLADFGMAGRIGAKARRRGAVVVTPHVSAPEVWDGLPLDGRADLYSFGALLYHTLTGAWPFEASEPAEFADLHRRATPPPPSERTPLAGPAIDGVLLRALAKTPDLRYATGAELAAALHDALRVDGSMTNGVEDHRVLVQVPDAARNENAAAIDGAAVAAASERLESFAASLDERGQAALNVVLRRSAAAGARASQDTEQMTMRVFAPVAALLALEDCGAAAALAAGRSTPREVAASCDLQERAISRLMELLAAVGLLDRDGERYGLPPGPAALYQAHAHAGTVGRPLRDAATFWTQLSRWVATGEPSTHMDRPDGAIYAALAPGSGLLSTPAAHELAETLVKRGLVPDGGHVLDVGAGSAVWSLAVATAAPQVSVTAVDRRAVLDQARGNADAAGLRPERFRTLPGDWRDVPLPPSAFDVAMLANLCHLEPPEEVRRLLGRVHMALRTGGVAVIVDTLPEAGTVDLGALLQDLHLALRTPGGGVHDRTSYEAWLGEAGFDVLESIVLSRAEGTLTALVAQRR